MPLLILLDSEGREQKRWRLRPGRLTLGRAESCDLIVPAAGVSRAHATLEVAADGQTAWFDPGSANGTFVNGLPARFLILRDGDRLRFGEASALYLEQEEDEALEPAQTPAAPGISREPALRAESLPPETEIPSIRESLEAREAAGELYAKLRCLADLQRWAADESCEPEGLLRRAGPAALRAARGARAALWKLPEDPGAALWTLLAEVASQDTPPSPGATALADGLSTASRPPECLRRLAAEASGPCRLRPARGEAAGGRRLEPASQAGGVSRFDPGAPDSPPVRALAFPLWDHAADPLTRPGARDGGESESGVSAGESARPFGLLYFESSGGNGGFLPADEEFLLAVGRAIAARALRAVREEREARRRRFALRALEGQTMIVGSSRAFLEALEQVDRLANTETTVLILGESGSGKELVARALHQFSRLRERPLVCVNCSALPETLVESELFGHERGAFTGAVQRRRGHFEMADGGALFLDEIGDLPQAAQAKFLRVLESGEIWRVGAERPLRVNVRVIAATNKSLENETRAGRFREDLFYRLNVVSVRVPSLRERPEDIEALVEYFLQTLRVKIPSPLRRFDAAAAARLRAYAWPGNVRQLRNVIERALVFAKGPVGGLDLLPPELLRPAEEPPPSAAVESPAGEEPPLPLAEMERRHILRALELCGGNKQQAAALLGISRSTLYEKLRELKK